MRDDDFLFTAILVFIAIRVWLLISLRLDLTWFIPRWYFAMTVLFFFMFPFLFRLNFTLHTKSRQIIGVYRLVATILRLNTCWVSRCQSQDNFALSQAFELALNLVFKSQTSCSFLTKESDFWNQLHVRGHVVGYVLVWLLLDSLQIMSILILLLIDFLRGKWQIFLWRGSLGVQGRVLSFHDFNEVYSLILERVLRLSRDQILLSLSFFVVRWHLHKLNTEVLSLIEGQIGQGLVQSFCIDS